MPNRPEKLVAEQQELNWLLNSGVLGRSGNLVRMLTFLCERHFAGDDQIKEYTIATEALGRRENFDPQSDTIVRVTAHSLRKRLQEIYQTEGANRPVHILLPPGHYSPSFVHREEAPATAETQELQEVAPQPAAVASKTVAAANTGRARWIIPTLIAFGIVLTGGLFFFLHRTKVSAAHSSPNHLPAPKNLIRALMGPDRRTYTDRSGGTWTANEYCSGDNIAVPTQKIAGTEDPYLYLGGIRGIARCTFPVMPGKYEIHLYFAETSQLESASRPATLSLNNGPEFNFDVVDSAGGDGIATSYVLANVRPQNDGAIHLDFTSAISLLNAIEILPTGADGALPVRITASPSGIKDYLNRQWISDRFFSGGRRGQAPEAAKKLNPGIYAFDRIGRFRYDIPVAYPGKYRVTLYFLEPWFGQHNWGNGGPGSRVFDVACNGNMLLKNFDIMAEGGAAPVTRSFDDIEPTTQGKIELSFIPVVNYPIVSAIEVVPEPAGK